jgi:hypothetical protein
MSYNKEDETLLKEEGFKKAWFPDKSGYWYESKIKLSELGVSIFSTWDDVVGGVIEIERKESNKFGTTLDIYSNKKINLFLNKWRKVKKSVSGE